MNGKPGRKQHITAFYNITAFYIETLVLIAAFIVVILVLARVFALAGRQSEQAQILTRAVRLAENAAEAVAASDSGEALAALLDENGNVCETAGYGGTAYRAKYDRDMRSAPEGDFWVDVTWQPQRSGAGTFVQSTVYVYWNGGEEPVYTLETAVYLPVSSIIEDTGGLR